MERLKGLCKHSPLLCDIEWLSKGMAKGPPEIDCPGRFHLHGIFPDDRYSYGRDTNMLNCPLYQSYGLVADSSARREQDDIYTRFFQESGNLRSGLVDKGR